MSVRLFYLHRLSISTTCTLIYTYMYKTVYIRTCLLNINGHTVTEEYLFSEDKHALLSAHSIVAFIAEAMWVTVCINRSNKSSKPTKEQQQMASVYDEVECQNPYTQPGKKIEVEKNVAYEDTRGQLIKLKKNEAYESVKMD